MKTGIELLISEVGKKIVNKTQEDTIGIISGLGIDKNSGKEYVIVSVNGSSSMTKDHLEGCCNLKIITEKLIPKIFNSSGIPMYSYCSMDDFFKYWDITKEGSENSIDLTFNEAKELFHSTISWKIKEKILKLYSKRQLNGLPDKIEYPETPQDYPDPKFRDSAMAFKELVWLIKEYTKASGLKEPNWENYSQDKFAIIRRSGTVMVSKEIDFSPIAFLSEKVANVFLEDHKELLEQYYMIGR